MALFKINKGPETNLNAQPLHTGYAWFTIDKHKLFIDIDEEPGGRVQVNAYGAEVLLKDDGSEIEVDDLLLKEIAVTVAQGGTGRDSLTANALLIGNGTDPVKLVSLTNNGILISDTTNGVKELKGTGALFASDTQEPEFGNLPVSAGGTGSNTAAGARSSLNVYSKSEVDDSIAQATTLAYTVTLQAAQWQTSGNQFTYTYTNTDLSCGKNHNVPPVITYVTNQQEYNNIDDAEATSGQGIVFTASKKPTADIQIIVIDVK